MRAATLRLPVKVDNKLQFAVDKGRVATKVELIRRAIDEFIEKALEVGLASIGL